MTQTHATQPIHASLDLGQAIRARRKRDGLTLAEVAGLTNVGIRFLSELENGKPTVRLDKVLQVVQALGLAMHISDPSAPQGAGGQNPEPQP